MSRQVVVIGGTSGIGRAIADALARECRVLITGRTAEEVDQARPLANGIEAISLDVARPDQIASIFRHYDRLDVLVNAAGMILRDGQEFDPESFARVVDVNLNGMMRICTAAKELLFASRGCVINIASMFSYFGSGYAPAYSASKGGVVQLTRSLAIAWAPHGVRINAIAPGWSGTALSAPLWNYSHRRDAMIARTPLARWGRPEDIAGAAVFLASPEAGFITGVVLPVDGGYSIA